MKLKVLRHDYENTGGNCMVGVSMAYDEDDCRTLFVVVNEEGGCICTADFIQNDLDWEDRMLLVNFDWDSFAPENDPINFEVIRDCRIQYVISDCKYFRNTSELSWDYLNDELRAQVTEHYHAWVAEENNGMFETDGHKIYRHEYYEEPEVTDAIQG